MSSAQPSQPSPPAPPTTSPPPPLSPDGTINNDSADPSFDPTSLDPDIDMAIDPSPTTQLPDAQLDGPAPDPSPTANGASEDTSKPPVQKDISLKDFLEKMDDYTPIVSSPPPSLFPLSPRSKTTERNRALKPIK